ncbi:alpha/beta hydrolase [Aliikangiella marina]|uniref:Alpha/beta hydrolase n=1 Tax=Aliikangiella marina TaxID=1712262 RepID=A0A545TJL0_9GAMM|nr:alpha/beta fold hydrolase [Aliikangiella marina]TQV77387.1 alpha/beta hydrolase [Aliikangiella marina]
MEKKTLQSFDGIDINYAITKSSRPGKPWIALIIPFGLKLEMARHFCEFFQPHYNSIVWETRSILEDSERNITENEFVLENHVRDLKDVLDKSGAKSFIMVGYCSGAGIALAAANRYPNIINNLILAHGEYTMLHDSACTTQFASEIDSLLSLAAKDEEHLNLVFEKIKGDRFEDSSNRPDGIDLPFTKKEFLRRHAANYLSYKSSDFEHLAEYVSHHTLILTGERDVQANVTSSQKIADLISNSEIYIDPEADHYGLLREDSSTMITIWNYLYEQQPIFA